MGYVSDGNAFDEACAAFAAEGDARAELEREAEREERQRAEIDRLLTRAYDLLDEARIVMDNDDANLGELANIMDALDDLATCYMPPKPTN